MTELEKLYEQARLGNKEAILELFNRNCSFIEKKAQFIFDSIKLNIKSHYKIENIPNGLIDYEDIEQDLKLRMYEIIIKYLNTNSQVGLSSYISHMIKSYINNVIEDKTNEIFNRLKIVSNNQISESNNFEDRNTIFELIDLVRRNPKFKNHSEFICDILNGLSLEEVANKYQIQIKGMSVKMKLISKLYQGSLNSENILYNYIVSGKIIEELKLGDIYKLSYFNKKIILFIHDLYFILRKYYINYDKFKYEYLELLCKYINVRKNNLNSNSDISKFMDIVLNNTKEIYLNHKIKELEYIKSCNYNQYLIQNRRISSTLVLSLIKKGDIYNIYPYCEYIDMVFNEIFIKLSENNYIEKRRLKSYLKLAINKIIKDFSFDLDIENFNSYFQKELFIIIYNFLKSNKKGNKCLIKK